MYSMLNVKLKPVLDSKIESFLQEKIHIYRKYKNVSHVCQAYSDDENNINQLKRKRLTKKEIWEE